MLEILVLVLALVLGILAGTISGLMPGIHINLVSAVLLSLSGFLLGYFTPITLVVFLASMAITHVFLDFVPSIFLGAPNEDDTALAVLPGHELLSKGQGYSAVILSLLGGLIGLGLIILFTPIFIKFLPIVFDRAKIIMPFILLTASFFLIYFEKSSKIWAIIIFLLSGFLGISSMNLNINEPLLPLFTGLFGISSLITSIGEKKLIPKQKIIPKLNILKSIKPSLKKITLSSIIASPICSFLPGMGSGQAAVIGSEVSGDLTQKEFLVLLGSINTLVTGLSFVALYSIEKARTGIAVAIDKILTLTPTDLFTILATIFLAAIISFFLASTIARYFSKYISKINYSKLSMIIILFLILITFIFSGFLGLLILAVSTSLGLTCIYSGVKRTHMMGCLLIPTILFYLF